MIHPKKHTPAQESMYVTWNRQLYDILNRGKQLNLKNYKTPHGYDTIRKSLTSLPIMHISCPINTLIPNYISVAFISKTKPFPGDPLNQHLNSNICIPMAIAIGIEELTYYTEW